MLDKDAHIKKLAKRIHNQRVALRENWEIIEMRAASGAAEIYRGRRPLKSRWWSFVLAKNAEIKRLKIKCGELTYKSTKTK
jgi:hypothetical protein